MFSQVFNKIPLPGTRGRPLDGLSADELESMVRCAHELHKRWTSPSPSYTRSSVIPTSDLPTSRLFNLHFVTRGGRSYLLSSNLRPPALGIRTIECWDLEKKPPVCVARRRGEGLRYVVNTDHESDASLAVKVGQEIEIIGLQANAAVPDDGFITLSRFPKRVYSLDALRGTTIVSRGPHQEHDPASIWDYRNPQVQHELVNPTFTQVNVNEPPLALDFSSLNRSHGQDELCFEALIEDVFVVILRTQGITYYPLTPFRDGVASPQILPSARYNFHWKLDAGRIVRRASSSNQRPKITFLIRFNSGYPWPVNILHHYDLIPAPDTPHAYNFPPTLIETIAAPVRLFGVPDMCIGRFGTALWLDTHVENYFEGEMGQGQRLAGKTLDEGNEDDDVASTVAATVYAFHDQDTWQKIAMDEEEGRIAIGTSDGLIKVLDYS